MLELKLSIYNYEEIKKQLLNLQINQIPFALSKALNTSGKQIKKYVVDTMPKIFHKPVPFTLGSVGFWPGTKIKPTVTIGFKEWASKGTPAVKYLQAPTYGGVRKHKRYEVALKSKGILKPHQFTVPAEAFRDAYGNVKRGEIIKMLSSLQAFSDVGFKANAPVNSSRAQEFFALKRKGKKLIIYKRLNKGKGKYKRREIVPFLYIIDEPKYPIIFEFDELVKKEFEKVWPKNLSDAINYAIATAKL